MFDMFAEALISLFGLLAVQAAPLAGTPVVMRELPVAKYVALPANGPIKKHADAYGVVVTARAAAIVDVGSGQVLFAKDADQAYPIASLTKLLTAMAFLDAHPALTDEMTILPEDEAHEGRLVFMPHERLTKGEVLQALLVGSVNAAANALARETGGKEAFVAAMNQKAKSLGMIHAFAADPTGLDPRNRASAKEVALALRAALSYPEIRAATGLEKIQLRGRATNRVYEIKATNLLLGSFLNKAPYRIVAGKTGSLPEAGYCLAQATRNQDGQEIIAVVLNSENHFLRFQDAKALTAWAFEQYSWSSSAHGAR